MVDDRIDIGTVFWLLDRDREPPMATCPSDDEPLVMTFEFPGAEFICVVCDRTYGFLSPKPAVSTPELVARQLELKAKYDAAREARLEGHPGDK